MVLAVRAEIRMNTDANVRSFRPMLPVFVVEQISLGLEKTGFGQRQFDFPAVAGFLHRHIAPGCAGVTGAARRGRR